MNAYYGVLFVMSVFIYLIMNVRINVSILNTVFRKPSDEINACYKFKGLFKNPLLNTNTYFLVLEIAYSCPKLDNIKYHLY